MTEQLLEAIDDAIATAAPAFHKQLEPPASEAALATLRAEVGELPAEVVAWFRWHAGSDDGFIPGTSWGLITIDEAIREVRFVRSPDGSSELAAATFAPLLTGRDGGVMYCVATSDGAVVWEYDRGQRVRTTGFTEWLQELLRAWRSEAASLRVSWIRRPRSPMGWHELQLPSGSRTRLRKLLAHPAITIDDCVRIDRTSAVRIEVGDAPSWRAHEDGGRLVITLTREGADELRAALGDKAKRTFRFPGLDDLRLAFVER